MAYNSDQQQRLCKARQAVSRLQTLLGGTSNDFELPGIVVVGPQSVGKSALLESICGIRLPSALGICTRCPLQLVMYHDTTKRSITLSYEHKGLQTTPEIDESDISKEVERVTKILTGNTNKIIDSVITLEIRSPTAPNLTVMDLPGVQGSSPADFPEDTKAVIDGLVTKACQGPSKIVCSLLEAGLDGGGQSCAWELLRKLDQIGSRTVGVLTKSDFAPKSGGSSAMRDNIQRIMAQYPLANGYYAVRNRISGEEDHLSMSDVCTLEKEYFAASTNFNPYVCETTVGKLVKKLENLQWDVYKENLPGLEAKLLQALAAHEGELRHIPKTVDSQTEAVAQLNNGLKEIANQVRAATSPNISGIKAELFNHEALAFGPKFKALSLKFISQVISAGGVVGPDGLTGFLWSPDVTSFFSDYMKRMSGTVLENLEGHPEFPGLAFEHVVLPRLRGPAEHLIFEVQGAVRSMFEAVVENVFKAYPALTGIVMVQYRIVAQAVIESIIHARTHPFPSIHKDTMFSKLPGLQVDAMLNKQADAAKAYIGESIEVLSGYHYTFNENYGIACRNLQQDAETFKGQAARPWEDIKSSLGFVSLAEPFLTTLFPSLGAVGGIAGVLATLVDHQTSAGQPQGPPAGTSGLPVKYFLQMSFAVYSKMVLDRVFDEYPLAIRMFFVQKVHKLLQNSALEIRLQDSPDKVWSAMKVGQEKDAERRNALELKVKQFKEVAAELSNPATAAPASNGQH